jgi:hypothetical protein
MVAQALACETPPVRAGIGTAVMHSCSAFYLLPPCVGAASPLGAVVAAHLQPDKLEGLPNS